MSGQGAGPETVLLPTTDDLCREAGSRHPPPDVKRTDALRTTDLVGRQRHERDRRVPDIDRQTRQTLRGIHMQRHAGGRALRGDRRNIVDHASLVVDLHDRHQIRAFGKRRRQISVVDRAMLVHREPVHGNACLRQRRQRIAGRRMLGDHGDDTRALADELGHTA